MKTVVYWSPFLTNVATISAVINSAKSLKLYSKNYRPIIINACGEFTPYKKNLEDNGIELKNLIKFDYHRFLPKVGFLKSRISYLIIFIISFFPLIHFLKKKKIEYIICHLITSLPLFISKIINTKTKFILRISGLTNLNLVRKFFWIYLGKNLFLVTCPTISTLNEIKNQKLFSEDKVVLLRDPVIRIKIIQNQKRQQLNINIDKKNFNIICIGRLTRQKNFEFIINNFQNILDIKDNSKLYILGEGEQKKYLEDMIEKRGLLNDIFLIGFHQNIHNILSKSNLFILTSLWEDPGWVLIEAACSNTLILSSNCKNGPEELIEKNKGGILFVFFSYKDFLVKIKQIFQLSQNEIFKKKVFSKKKSKLFTVFNHYLSIEKLLK